jgi:hypothetical protein
MATGYWIVNLLLRLLVPSEVLYFSIISLIDAEDRVGTFL